MHLQLWRSATPGAKITFDSTTVRKNNRAAPHLDPSILSFICTRRMMPKVYNLGNILQDTRTHEKLHYPTIAINSM